MQEVLVKSLSSRAVERTRRPATCGVVWCGVDHPLGRPSATGGRTPPSVPSRSARCRHVEPERTERCPRVRWSTLPLRPSLSTTPRRRPSKRESSVPSGGNFRRAQEERQLARTCRHGANFRRAPCKRVDEWRQTDAPTRDELAPRGATRWHRAHTTSCDTVVDAGAGCDGKSQPAVSPRGGPRLAAVGTNVAYGRDQRWRTRGATNAMGWLGDRLAVTAAGGVGRAVRTPRRARASRGCTRGGRPENDKSGAGHA